MNSLGDPKRRASRKVRVMLQISDWCELPDYVPDAEYFPFGLTTASVPANRLDELQRHPGVRAVWLQAGERIAWARSRPDNPSVELQVPAELVGPVAALLPGLMAKGARRLEVFRYSRPGETAYWLAFIVTKEGRSVVGTPDLRQLSLEAQLPAFLEQLGAWEPGATRDGGLEKG